ncbi:MAG: hypothetical protein OEW37_10750 [Rhodospirillaceae bacterium]|nr:hypothetical protein [Rhodospirillaceae bacterium]
MQRKPKDYWRRRWLVIRLCLLASFAMAAGLFFTNTAHAAAIAGAITAIVLALLGFVGVYVGGAVVDDNSKRKYQGGDDV